MGRPQDARLGLKEKIARIEANSRRKRYRLGKRQEIKVEQYEVVTSWEQVLALGSKVIILIFILIFTVLRTYIKRLLF